MTISPHRKRGRPRSFEDEQIFRIISELLVHGRLSDVTLDRVAKLAGTSNQAVSQRFASKAGLLDAYVTWLHAIVRDDIGEILNAAISPLQKFRRLMVLPINPRVLPNPSASPLESWIPLLMELNRDPALARLNAERRRWFNSIGLQLIEEAQQRGELRPVEPERVLELVWSVLMGAAILWEQHAPEDIITKMVRCMDGVLDPFTTGTPVSRP
jgi:AcrR family transcriptional regulator